MAQGVIKSKPEVRANAGFVIGHLIFFCECAKYSIDLDLSTWQNLVLILNLDV
jgi:hypothetical protein